MVKIHPEGPISTLELGGFQEGPHKKKKRGETKDGRPRGGN